MKNKSLVFLFLVAQLMILNCTESKKAETSKSASEILGNPDYPAMCFGGFRELSRATVPTVVDLKEDLKVLSAIGVKILRTYNVTGDNQIQNLLQAIEEMKSDNDEFEMYVMLGVWISCEVLDDAPIHDQENFVANKSEVDEAILLTQKHPDIVKIISVGNESMVHWQGYHVAPDVILRWVNELQDLKKKGDLPTNLWITSSDNFASWGGGDAIYHKRNLEKLVKAVDFIAMHTYPFHDTHYTPQYWQIPDIDSLSDLQKIHEGMDRASNYAISQYESVKRYVTSLGIPEKPIHMTETGWSSMTNDLYGEEGSRAADEYKQKLYYDQILDWSIQQKVTCFYFEMFDEKWKDSSNPLGSENHFGLINLNGQAKHALWNLVDQGTFEGITRNGYPITKTFNGDKELLMKTVLPPKVLEPTLN